MITKVKWWYYDFKRLWRLWVEPERSMRLAVRVTGVWWLWRHGIRRELKVKLWNNESWVALDLANLDTGRAVEIDGAVHKYTKQRDILRDQRLEEKGWEVMRVKYDELILHPARTRRRIRRFLG